jgi:hypothetical protein
MKKDIEINLFNMALIMLISKLNKHGFISILNSASKGSQCIL